MDVHLAHCCTNCADIRVRLHISDTLHTSNGSREQDFNIHDARYQPRLDLKVADRQSSKSCSLTPSSASHSSAAAAATTADTSSKKKQVVITEVHPCNSSTDDAVLFYRCIVHHLQPGTSYIAKISCGGDANAAQTETISFTTLDDGDLGRRRIRLGILTDLHINNHKHASDGKRLYKSSKMLAATYAKKMILEHRFDRIILPGDVCDTGSVGELHAAANILKTVGKIDPDVEIHAVIGNHEANPQKFAQILVPESPKLGYYSITPSDSGVHLIMLATDEQNSLDEGTSQLDWLRNDLEAASTSADVDIIFLFMHYSLVLHPLHDGGAWDDGLQLLDNSEKILDLLRLHLKVKAVVCGHKNVPSALMDRAGILHTLSPQLIQVPCGYDVVDVYDHGLLRTVHEIDEMDLQEVSRGAAGDRDTRERWGEQRHRSMKYLWGRRY